MIKLSIDIYRTGISSCCPLRILCRSGGFPSVHASLVASISTLVFLIQGASLLFSVVLTFSLLICYDAMGVRLQVGKQGKILNTLTQESKKPLNERVGHTFGEVLGGIVLGIGMTYVLFHFLGK